MRYFAEVENEIVLGIKCSDVPDTLSASFTWVETFLDGGSRRNMAVAGGNYNSENDVFYAEQPYDLLDTKHIHMGVERHLQQNQKVIMFGMKQMVHG